MFVSDVRTCCVFGPSSGVHRTGGSNFSRHHYFFTRSMWISAGTHRSPGDGQSDALGVRQQLFANLTGSVFSQTVICDVTWCAARQEFDTHVSSMITKQLEPPKKADAEFNFLLNEVRFRMRKTNVTCTL